MFRMKNYYAECFVYWQFERKWERDRERGVIFHCFWFSSMVLHFACIFYNSIFNILSLFILYKCILYDILGYCSDSISFSCLYSLSLVTWSINGKYAFRIDKFISWANDISAQQSHLWWHFYGNDNLLLNLSLCKLLVCNNVTVQSIAIYRSMAMIVMLYYASWVFIF